MTNNVILKAINIHRQFKTIENSLSVLKGLNLELKEKETAAITGASGVGKSTLLHILGGLDKPTEGEVFISGESLKGKSESSLAGFRNEKIGFVFQFHYLMEDFTALENVMIPLLVANRKKSEAKNKGELILEQVGLIDRRNHRPNQLSGGEQQRVAVARALVNNPSLILADEPSGNLDTATGRKLHELLMKINEENNVTMLIATHNQELAGLCDRFLSIKDGVIEENQN